ncbi:MAG: cytidine deaminase [Chloroflexota bacterium]|nr:cytidine deaminase [Chloroflexota bacterium]
MHDPLNNPAHDPALDVLMRAARDASTRAYIPYSGYPVGAALRALDGTVYTGCNVENAAYPAGICAERTALVKAISEGARQFDLLVVYTVNGGSPCGICRQMLYEFAPSLRVVLIDAALTVTHDVPLHELLPRGFGAASLPGASAPSYSGLDGATAESMDGDGAR